MEIKEGMVIHCKTEAEAEKLFKCLYGLGYQWINGTSLLKGNEWTIYTDETCYWTENNKRLSFGSVDCAEEMDCTITEFSDLYLREPIDVPYVEVTDEPEEAPKEASDYSSMLRAMMQ